MSGSVAGDGNLVGPLPGQRALPGREQVPTLRVVLTGRPTLRTPWRPPSWNVWPWG